MNSTKGHILSKQIIPAKLQKKNKFIIQEIKNCHDVLDVGCVGQAIENKSELWLHKHLKDNANRIVGVDIDKNGIKNLSDLGFNVIHVDELKDDKFDIIVMADIIEHIGNLEDFLLFYKQKLKVGGKMIITTPNPFSIRQVFNILLFKQPFINEEHTCFLDPITIMELLERCQMELINFSWIFEHAPPKTFTSKVLHKLSELFFRIRKYYSPNFGVICQISN